MKLIKKLFHFLGGISFALTLITFAALFVVTGSFLESHSGSHQWAALWTYEHPVFLLLLSLFFINILFSALRRWPFKPRHIPFLITHLGLLMIITGTVIKSRFGIQGNLSVWEGSGSHTVILPYTHALYIEKNDYTKDENDFTLIPLKSFSRNVYYPKEFPGLKCKIKGFAPHVKQEFETWVKGNKAYIKGLPVIELQEWEPDNPLPKGILTQLALNHPQKWLVLAIASKNNEELIPAIYLQDLSLKLFDKQTSRSIELPLKKAISNPFYFSDGFWEAAIDFEQLHPRLSLNFKSDSFSQLQKYVLPLEGEEALFVKGESEWSSPFFTVDLIRPHPTLSVIKNEQGSILCACDPHGRLHVEHFNLLSLNSLYSYGNGFGGYVVQSKIPFPAFSTSRQDKENSHIWNLTTQLRSALESQPQLNPPLNCLKKACEKLNFDFPSLFVEFLFAWHASPSLLFQPNSLHSPSLKKALAEIEWKDLSMPEWKGICWIHHLFDQLDQSYMEGVDYLTSLEQHKWPFIENLKETIKNSNELSPPNILAAQVTSILNHLPPFANPQLPFSVDENGRFLSAFFRAYGIDYFSLTQNHNEKHESFEILSNYWGEKENNRKGILSLAKEIILEVPLTINIIPDHSPPKMEDSCPGIVLELEQNNSKQTLALAYDSTAYALKHPILGGSYAVRFQPRVYSLPYHIRLRQARQISYPHSSQTYSYESDILITEQGNKPISETLSMNKVYETLNGTRLYLAGIGASEEPGIKKIQLVVNHDPAKYYLTYPGGLFVFIGILLLFWLRPYKKKANP